MSLNAIWRTILWSQLYTFSETKYLYRDVFLVCSVNNITTSGQGLVMYLLLRLEGMFVHLCNLELAFLRILVDTFSQLDCLHPYS